jgi:DNA-binding GntR family transcriptional regulator
MVLKHIELVDRVYSRVKKMIFDRKLEPGQKILQEKLAAHMGVSRSPLLKALHRLETDMLVENIPRRGYFVKDLGEQEIIDIFQCRAVIEGLSARLAAEKASSSEIERLRALFLPFSNQDQIDIDTYVRMDRKFHDMIIELSGNGIITRLDMLSNIQLRAYMAGLLRPPEETLSEHMAIIDAIEAHDGLLAEQRMRDHIDKSRRSVEHKKRVEAQKKSDIRD